MSDVTSCERVSRRGTLTGYKLSHSITDHQISSSAWKSRRLAQDSADLHNFTRWGQTGWTETEGKVHDYFFLFLGVTKIVCSNFSTGCRDGIRSLDGCRPGSTLHPRNALWRSEGWTCPRSVFINSIFLNICACHSSAYRNYLIIIMFSQLEMQLCPLGAAE